MKKSEILENYSNKTGISYKHQDLFVGDVYKGELGTLGVVLSRKLDDGSTKYYFKKTNMCEHGLPENRAGLNNGTFVANVVQDDTLMQQFIDAGIIIDDDNEETEKETETMAKEEVKEPVAEVVPPPPAPVKEEKPKRATKKTAEKEQPKEEQPKEEKATTRPVTKGIYAKINAVRAAWTKENIEKTGKGRAGGGAKYDYYKPQQIIDFALKEEIKNNLFSDFNIIDGTAIYTVTDMDWREGCIQPQMVSCQCPADIPRKMAASEAQQVGAAMTYFNRRLAMMMYKIEDNSRESVEVLEDADYTSLNAPTIPAPPVVPVPPIMGAVSEVETQLPPPPVTNIQAEVNSKPVDEPKVEQDKVVPPPVENAKSDNVAAENEQKDATVPPPPPVTNQNTQGAASVPPPPPVKTEVVTEAQPPVQEEKKMGSIADLY